MIKIGLTGGIGCGKSTVLEIFSQFGCKVISSDTLCFEVYQKHQDDLIRAFSDRWTQNVLNNNGLINRAHIAEIVFSDPDELAYLNQLLHPLIEKELEEQMQISKSYQYVVVEVPLLYEINWQDKFDKIIAVWSPESIVTKHLMERGMSQCDIVARCNAQMSAEEKLKRADLGIINHGTKKALHAQCLKLFNNKM